MRQRTSRFKKLVNLVETEDVPVKWLTDEEYLELEGFLALDGGVAEEGVLTAAWSCMQAGIVNVLCKYEEAERNWKPVIAAFSITDEEGKVKLKHKSHMKATEKIPEAMESFRADLKQLKADLKEVKSLDKMPDEAELLAQLMLRITVTWREYVEEKLRSGRVRIRKWRDLEKVLKK